MLKDHSSVIHPSIFRAYDIRGIVGQTLTEENVYLLGKAFGSFVREHGEKRVAVARDGRLSGPDLFESLCKGIMTTGCDVMALGMVPTPLLYYSTFVLEETAGVMLTGSHNPPEYNGLKLMMRGQTLAEERIMDLYHRINETRFVRGDGERREIEIVERYITHICRDIHLQRPLKVVVDAGNGVASVAAVELYRRLGCEVDELYCEVDGRFPHHHPDPSYIDNLQDLIKRVRATQADVGIAFDGDGDRLGIVTPRGELICPDRQLMLFAKSVLSEHPGGKIIYDVKCTRHLDKFIRDSGGEPIMWKTGHSLIKAKLAETRALLAGEMSGHLFFKDRWYGFDDAIYAGARFLEILAKTDSNADGIFEAIPNSINTPELKVLVSEDEKFTLMQKLIKQANFMDAGINTLDGIRIDFPQGWGLVRPSNTTPYLICRFEADDQTILTKIQNLFRDWMLSVEPGLVLPF